MLDEGDVELRDSSFGLLDATNWKIPSEEIEMGQRIATGTYGTVFCGAYRGFTVANKQLKHESDYNPNKFEETVLAEAQFLANMQHPNIVKFFGVARERGAEGPGGRTLSTGRSAGYTLSSPPVNLPECVLISVTFLAKISMTFTKCHGHFWRNKIILILVINTGIFKNFESKISGILFHQKFWQKSSRHYGS